MTRTAAKVGLVFRKAGYDTAALENALRNGSLKERNFYNELLRRSGIAGNMGSFALSISGATISNAAVTSITRSDALSMAVYPGSFFYLRGKLLPAMKGYYRKRVSEYMGRRAARYLLAEDGSGAFGVLSCYIYRRGSLRTAAMGELFIEEGHRGRGAGARLVERALSDMRRYGCRAVTSAVRPRNLKAHAFWRKLGFAITPEPSYPMRRGL